jgi:peroxiredoxin Q/BCP
LVAFQRDLEKFRKEDTLIIGVSKDSMETNKKFTKEYDIRFPMISDKDNNIRRLYGGGRITYLIDKNGVIQFIQKGVPENDAFLKALKKLQS